MDRLIQRFLQSRIWPIASIVLLFCCAMAVAGGLLWTARVRESVDAIGIIQYRHVVGAASPAGECDELHVNIIGKAAVGGLATMEPGQAVHIAAATANGAEVSVDARLVELSGEGRGLRLRLSPGEDVGREAALTAMSSNAARVHITFRGKRLLVAAFEKNAS